MRKNKKTVMIGGGLLSPLEIGVCAAIREFNGDFIFTEPVQTIIQENCKNIKFETQDSIYHLLPQLAPARKMRIPHLLAA